MDWFTFTATNSPDWAKTFLVYVNAEDIPEAYNKLEDANFADWRLTDRPSVHTHLEVVDIY
jgi:hypothetical protein